ncbi:MAG: hypothetical protein JNM36_16130 [Chitinophagales bacterium]|nr:hypothetical protein [Chitinophagales bacterium]
MYTTILKVDQACNWYSASVGSHISIICATVGAPNPICITADIINVSCSVVGGVKLVHSITVSSDKQAIAELAGLTISTVAPFTKVGTETVKITSIIYSKWMAILSLLD